MERAEIKGNPDLWTKEQVNEFLARELMGWIFGTEAGRYGLASQSWYDAHTKIYAYDSTWSPYDTISQALGDADRRTVVGKMRERGWYYNVQDTLTGKPDRHGAMFFHKKTQNSRYAHADTPARAIVKAAVMTLRTYPEDTL